MPTRHTHRLARKFKAQPASKTMTGKIINPGVDAPPTNVACTMTAIKIQIRYTLMAA